MQNNRCCLLYHESSLHLICKASLHNLLPHCKTRVLDVSVNDGNVKLKFLIAAATENEIAEWRRDYEEKSCTAYSLTVTAPSTGRYVLFKQRLHCIRNTKCSRTCTPDINNRTRNTNCPSTIMFTIRAIKKKYQGKDPKLAPDPSMPCVVELVTTHNHSLNSVDVLRFRAVSDDVKDKLIKLYHEGHSVATAIKSIQDEIRNNYEDYESMLVDRRFCPDYNYCYYIYKQELKKKNSDLAGGDPDSNKLIGNAFTTCKQEVNKSEDEENYAPLFVECCKDEIEDEDNITAETCVEGIHLLSDISSYLTSFLKASPEEITHGLRLMNEQILKLKTPSAIALACANFGSDIVFKKRKRIRNAQSSTTNKRRKPNILRKTNVRGGSKNV